MITASKDRVEGIQFYQPTDRIKFNVESEFYKRFQAEIKDQQGFDLILRGIWSINLQNGIGVDPETPALALTTKGIKEGGVGVFGGQGFFRVEVGIKNTREIPDVEEILLDLRYSRCRSKLHLSGSLPNLGTSQVGGPVSGLIAIAEIGEDKANTKGSVAKSVARIPGAIEQWKTEDGNVIYFMARADAATISKLYVDFTVVKRAAA